MSKYILIPMQRINVYIPRFYDQKLNYFLSNTKYINLRVLYSLQRTNIEILLYR